MLSSSQKELCKRIKENRLVFPLTQEELAQKTGLSLRSIRNLENGKDAKVSTLLVVLEYLGLWENVLSVIPDPNESQSIKTQKEKGLLPRKRVRRKKLQQK